MKKNKIKFINNFNNKNFKSKSDPQGSYTGTCKNPKEKPVQDADDL